MKNKNKKGFTLIELIVVISILVVLLLILVPTMNGFVNDAKKQANNANARSVYTAITANDTAIAGGLYTASSTDISICGAEKVNQAFWSGSTVAGCTVTRTDSKLAVTVGTGDTHGKYPLS